MISSIHSNPSCVAGRGSALKKKEGGGERERPPLHFATSRQFMRHVQKLKTIIFQSESLTKREGLLENIMH